MKTFGRIAGAAAASLALVLAPVGAATAASSDLGTDRPPR